MISLKLSNLSHEFEDRIVFSGLCFEFSGTSLAVTGPNGSGKTTLLKLLAGLLTPTSGGAHIQLDDRTLQRRDLCDLVGYAGPDARLYPEMTPRENLRFIAKARCLPEPEESIDSALRQVKLESRADDLISALSSGLSQRASLAAAILHSPRVLLLDEPSTGLDEHGIETLHSIVGEQARSGMVVIATNDPTEAGLAAECIQLG